LHLHNEPVISLWEDKTGFNLHWFNFKRRILPQVLRFFVFMRAHNFKDLTGQVFGKLTVINLDKSGKNCRWNCLCECGVTKSIRASHILAGKINSCGCLLHRDSVRFIDLTGLKFNRLTVVSLNIKGKRTKWNCICDCGNECVIEANRLKKGISKSCGCFHKEATSKAKTTHGITVTNKRLYNVWRNMLSRCYKKNNENYKYYGGKGVVICDLWLSDNSIFFSWALSNGYTKNMTIERKDSNGNYEPSNCTFIPQSEQSQNTTISIGKEKVIEIKKALKNGVKIRELATKYGFHYDTIWGIKSGKSYSNVIID